MFVYYWVPTPVHISNGSLAPSFYFSRAVISDLNNKTEIFLYISKMLDLYITLSIDKVPIETHTLKYVNSNDAGLIVYKIPDNVSQETLQIIKIQSYHLYKNYFHDHEFHDDNHDSLLQAYISSNQYDDQKAVENYCRQYDEKFDAYKQLLSENDPNIVLDYYKKLSIINVHTEAISMAKNDIHDMLGEMIYADFLTQYANEREYVDVAKIYGTKFSRFKKDFELLYKRYELLYENIQLSNSVSINQFQTYLAVGGIGLGVISIIIGVISIVITVSPTYFSPLANYIEFILTFIKRLF